jgi:hypothetical protein
LLIQSQRGSLLPRSHASCAVERASCMSAA